MRLHTFFYLVLLFVTHLKADISNRGAFPFGEIEGFIGNAGVGGAGSTGAVYYNPAALVELNHPKIAVSGSTYFHFRTDNDNIIRVDNTDLDYSASGFNTVPSSVVSTFKNDSFSWAYFVLVPESNQIENQVSWATPNTSTSIIQMNNASELWLGAAAGFPITSNLAIGGSLYAIRHTSLEHSSIIIDTLTATNTTSTTISHTSESVYGLSATLGILYKPVNWLSAGLRIQSPLLHLSGTGTGFSGTRTVNNGTLTNTNLQDNNLSARYTLPLDMTLGFRAVMQRGWDLHFDTSLQTGLEYSRYPGSQFNVVETVKTTPRFSLGSRMGLSNYAVLSAGVFYNPSATPETATVSNPLGHIDYWGITGGIDFAYDRVKTGIGGFFAFSRAETQQIGNPAGLAKSDVRFIGAMVNIGYYL